MSDNIKSFAQVYEREKSDLTSIHAPQYLVGDGDERGGSAVILSESMLVLSIEMMRCKILIKLMMNYLLDDLAYCWNICDGPIVGWI